MKFDMPAASNAIDKLRLVGQPIDRIDGPMKTTGTALYAYENSLPHLAYGYVVGSSIAKGLIKSMETGRASSAPGVIAVVTAENAGKLGKGDFNAAKLLGGPEIQHYHQAVALVVAESFEQARSAAALVRVDYAEERGQFDLAAARATAAKPKDGAPDSAIGNFDRGFERAEVKVDETYTTPDQSHAHDGAAGVDRRLAMATS
jgi:xanthine dehydrogenase YagR molybdenum-binding subunit